MFLNNLVVGHKSYPFFPTPNLYVMHDYVNTMAVDLIKYHGGSI